MRQFLRWLWLGVSATSAVLFIAVAALWARSAGHADVVGYEGRESPDQWQRGGYVSSGRGVVGCVWWLRQNPAKASRRKVGWAYTSLPVQAPAPAVRQPWHGFSYSHQSFDGSRPRSDGRPTPRLMTYTHQVTLPHWSLLLACIPPPAVWLFSAARRRRVRRRRGRNLCPSCGYDLRASPGVCPECGAAA